MMTETTPPTPPEDDPVGDGAEPGKKARKRIPYSSEVAEEFLERLASRESFEEIYGDASMPSERTVRAWRSSNEEFAAAFKLALEARAESRNREVERIGNELKAKRLDPQGAKVLADLEARLQASEHPSRFSPKTSVEVAGPGGKPIEIRSESPDNLARRIELIFALPSLIGGGQATLPPPAKEEPSSDD